MARAATVTQEAGLSGLEFGLAIPGTVGGAVWANAGAHDADIAAVLEIGPRHRRRRHRDDAPARRARAGLSRQPAQGVRRTGAPEGRAMSSSRRRSSSPPADPDVDHGAARRDPALAPGASAAGHAVGRAARSATRRATRPAGSSIRPASRGLRIGGASVSEKHANFLVNDQKRHARRRAPAGRPGPGEVLARHGRRRSTTRSCSRATGPAGSRTARDRPRPPSRRGPARRPVGGARRLARVRVARSRPRSGRRGHAVERWLIDLDGGWWRLPAGSTGATDRPAPRYDDPAALGATGPVALRRRLERLRPARPRARRLHRAPRPVRRGRHRPGAARGGRPGLHRLGRGGVGGGHGQDRSSSGCARGIDLPVVRLARGPRPRAGRPIRPRVLAELEAFAAATGDPRLIVKPARLGSSSASPSSTTRPSCDGGPRGGLRARQPGPRRGVPGRRPRARGGRRGQRPGRPRAVRAGRDPVRPRVLRLRRQVHPGPVRDLDPAPSSTDRQRATILKIARDAYRAIGAEGFARRRLPARRRRRSILSEINTIPGFTPISLFPAMPRRGRLRLRRHLRAGSSSSAWSVHAAASGRRLTRGRPAPMSRRPSPTAPRADAAAAPARPIRRSSAGLSRDPGRCGALVVLVSARRSTASAPRRPFDFRHARASTGAPCTNPADVEAAARRWRDGDEPGRPCRPTTAGGRARGAADRPLGRGRRRPAGHAARSTLDERQPILVWQAGDRRFLVDADGIAFAPAGRRRARPNGRAAGHRRPADAAGSASASARRSIRSTSTPPPGSASLTPADLGSSARPRRRP